MSMYYKHDKTNSTTVVGKIASIADDRMSLTIEAEVRRKGVKEPETLAIEVKSATPIDEEFSVGKRATAVGFNIPDMADPNKQVVQAMSLSCRPQAFEWGKLAVVSGEVLFASFNEEKNEDGTPRMTREYTAADGSVTPAHEKKPHFDISVKVKEADENGDPKYVLHTVQCYPWKGDMTQIDRYKKLFANFDRENNPCFATIVTQPGNEYAVQKVVNGKEYINYNSRHMGITKIDVEFEKVRENTKSAEAAPAKVETPAPVPAPEPIQAPASKEPADDDYFM